MAERDYQQGDADSVPLAEWVDEIADRYEAAWQGVLPPRIADFLGEATGERRAALAAELGRIDRAYRDKVSDRRTPDDYRDELAELAAPATGDVARPTPLPQRVLPAAAVPAGLAIAGYELLGELGHGGMGMVVKARHVGLKRMVALKMIRAGALANPRALARFRTEMETLARLQHPNIVQIYEVGEQDAQPYCALEYVDGGSLAQKLAGAPQPPRQSAQLMETLARAVQAAHQVGIVHRDLKPANVLLTAEGTAKITDFGLAKQLGGDAPGEPAAAQTQTGEIVGTPSYMAPEQAEGKPRALGPAADIYALGAILYELLTGRPPFQGETLLDTLEQVRTQEPVPPRRLQPKVPRDLETICLKCLHKKSTGRYASAADLAADLDRYLNGQTIQARPAGVSEKAWRWCRRRPAVAGLLAALVLVMVGGLAGMTGLWLRAEYERDHTDEQRRHAVYERGQADEQRGRADKNLALIIHALNEVNTKIQNNQRLSKHDLEDLRKELLQSVVNIYQRLKELESDNPQVESERARALGWLARITYEVGTPSEALDLFLRERAVYEKLSRDYPEVPDHRRRLANTCNNLGNVYRGMYRWQEADKAHQRARDVWEALVAAHPDNAEFAIALANSYGALGNVYSDAGRPADLVETAYNKCLEIYERLAGTRAEDRGFQSARALWLNNLAVFYRETSKLEKAEETHRKALAVRKQLFESDRSNPDYQAELAMSYFNLGNLSRDLERPLEPEQSYQQALDLQRPLANKHPLVTEYQAALARTCSHLGSRHYDEGRLDPAEELLRQALKVWEKLSASPAAQPDHMFFLGYTTRYLGLILLARGEPKGALDWFAKAIRTADGVFQQDKSNADARDYLSSAHDGRAEALMRLGRDVEARKDWDTALGLATEQARARLRLAPALALAQRGAHADATTEAQAVAAKPPQAGDIQYHAACVLAVSSAAALQDARLPQADRALLAEQYAARAVELLKKAQAVGYFNGPPRIRQLTKDMNLAPLRSREDFRKLVAPSMP